MCHVESPDSFSCFKECLLSSDSREYLKPAEILRFGRFYLSNGEAYFSNWPISLKQKAFCENSVRVFRGYYLCQTVSVYLAVMAVYN